jgi:hypothetical protein
MPRCTRATQTRVRGRDAALVRGREVIKARKPKLNASRTISITIPDSFYQKVRAQFPIAIERSPDMMM